MGFYATSMDTITYYSGLSPPAFFTILALMYVVYKVVCGMFVAADDYMAVKRTNDFVLREPVQLGDVTVDELRAYDGSDPNKPLLMAIKGQIYDVSRSRMFYGPGGPYALFAGRDASRALALMSFESKDLTGNIDGLSPDELEVLQDWEYKFMEKYVKVGQVVSEKSRIEHNEDEDKVHENHSAEETGTQYRLIYWKPVSYRRHCLAWPIISQVYFSLSSPVSLSQFSLCIGFLQAHQVFYCLLTHCKSAIVCAVFLNTKFNIMSRKFQASEKEKILSPEEQQTLSLQLKCLSKEKSYSIQKAHANVLDSILISDIRKQIGPAANKFPTLFSDTSILRFLRARNWNTKKATKMLKDAFKWQLDFKQENIRWEDIAHEAETGKIYRADYFYKHGRSVVVMRPGYEMVKPIIDQKMYQKVRFVHSNDPESRKTMESIFDMGKVESAFGGKNKVGIDDENTGTESQSTKKVANVEIDGADKGHT
ncbi:hypothetical protein POM88_041464 [Heracleum sosnowskyi]|uniref:Cytochrome b5 heme-binding domain-containing protein n=1 Tax=Heracleum sosnowskyi TaxID=360622 RepID=A0AAD8HFY3_9APIA|nr:hypothetical protein POM88_041464 [Heracleum sosnowskyi]